MTTLNEIYDKTEAHIKHILAHRTPRSSFIISVSNPASDGSEHSMNCYTHSQQGISSPS
jgi:hypothetical protein